MPRLHVLRPAALLSGVLLLFGSGLTIAADASVTAENNAFSPENVTIRVGDGVTWTNLDDHPHTATADEGAFHEVLLPGQAVTVTFDAAGTFAYHCNPHPFMTATVTVEAAGGGDPASTNPATDVDATARAAGPSSPILVAGLLLFAAVAAVAAFAFGRRADRRSG